MGTTTGVGFVPTPTQVEEYTHRLTGNKTGTVYTHTHTHTLDVRSRQPPEPTGSTPEETNRGSGAACYNDDERSVVRTLYSRYLAFVMASAGNWYHEELAWYHAPSPGVSPRGIALARRGRGSICKTQGQALPLCTPHSNSHGSNVNILLLCAPCLLFFAY